MKKNLKFHEKVAEKIDTLTDQCSMCSNGSRTTAIVCDVSDQRLAKQFKHSIFFRYIDVELNCTKKGHHGYQQLGRRPIYNNFSVTHSHRLCQAIKYHYPLYMYHGWSLSKWADNPINRYTWFAFRVNLTNQVNMSSIYMYLHVRADLLLGYPEFKFMLFMACDKSLNE